MTKVTPMKVTVSWVWIKILGDFNYYKASLVYDHITLTGSLSNIYTSDLEVKASLFLF